jgi:hypothetical protein
VINDWSAAGVNVVVKQVFDDEFVIGEMSYFNTAPGVVETTLAVCYSFSNFGSDNYDRDKI